MFPYSCCFHFNGDPLLFYFSFCTFFVAVVTTLQMISPILYFFCGRCDLSSDDFSYSNYSTLYVFSLENRVAKVPFLFSTINSSVVFYGIAHLYGSLPDLLSYSQHLPPYMLCIIWPTKTLSQGSIHVLCNKFKCCLLYHCSSIWISSPYFILWQSSSSIHDPHNLPQEKRYFTTRYYNNSWLPLILIIHVSMCCFGW